MKTKKTIFITVSFLLACSTFFSKSYLSNRVLKSNAIPFLAYNATKNSLANQSSSLTTIWNGTIWSNGIPDASTDAIISCESRVKILSL
jgi:hypothetical protein